jgi:hypothetical protein
MRSTRHDAAVLNGVEGERIAMTLQLSDREARADHYFEQDLKGQREWYGQRASTYKNWTQLREYAC